MADSDRSLAQQISELLELIRQYGLEGVASAIEKASAARALGRSMSPISCISNRRRVVLSPPLKLRDLHLNELVTDPVSLLAYDAFILEIQRGMR